MIRVRTGHTELELGPADFVARGGQAEVYARDGRAYKLFLDPAQVPSRDRVRRLQGMAGPGLITPDGEVTAPDGTRLGITMPFLAGWTPLCGLFATPAKQRAGLDPAGVGRLVLALRALVAQVHAHGALIVDLNEANALVDPTHQALALIDADSWQLPGHPATALAETVRDRHASAWTTGTDWFAFAIVSFQLFVGVHPYRGQHPTAKTLDARMSQDLSVFHPEVVVPPMVDLSQLPAAWRDWYEAMFALRERTEPPPSLTAWGSRAPAPLPGAVIEVLPFARLTDPIVGFVSWDARVWAWTTHGTFEEGRRIGPAPGPDELPVRAESGLAFARCEAGRVRVRLADGSPVECGVLADALTAHQGLLHARSGASLVELTVRRLAGGWVTTGREAARVMPQATSLFRGIYASSVMGACWIGLLGPGTCRTVRVPELDGRWIVDAQSSDGFAVVIARGPDGWTRHLIGPDGHRSCATDLPSAGLLVLPTGIALVQTDHGLEVCTSAAGPCRAVTAALPPLAMLAGRPGYPVQEGLFAVALRR